MKKTTNQALFNLFGRDYVCSLKESSLDNHTGNSKDYKYMTEKKFDVIKLDDFIKYKYRKDVNAKKDLNGVDSVFIYKDKFYFIEFKNGKVTSSEKKSILEKMYASPYILIDKLNVNISALRLKSIFILVYNYKGNKQRCDNELHEIIREKDKVEMHSGLKRFIDFLNLVKNNSIKESNLNKFSLDKLEKYIYNEVYAIPEKLLDIFLIQEGFPSENVEQI